MNTKRDKIILGLGGTMRKRIYILVTVVLTLVLTFTVLHRKFNKQSRLINAVAKANQDSQMEYDTYKQFLIDNPGKHVFFIENDSDDSDYIWTSIFTPLTLEFENALPNVSRLCLEDAKLSVVNIKKNFKVEKIPSFIVLETTDDKGNYTVLSSISYDQNDPFDLQELKEWFHVNGFWDAPIAIR